MKKVCLLKYKQTFFNEGCLWQEKCLSDMKYVSHMKRACGHIRQTSLHVLIIKHFISTKGKIFMCEARFTQKTDIYIKIFDKTGTGLYNVINEIILAGG